MPIPPTIKLIPAFAGNYGSRSGAPISLVIVHIMEGAFAGTGAWFQNPGAHVSTHYGISVDGAIAQYVSDEFEAWHAGTAEYNARSIGVELEGHSDDPDAFTAPMMGALVWLANDLCDLYGLLADRQHFIGHNEVPDPRHPGQLGGAGHHRDPGPYFPWDDFIASVAGYPVRGVYPVGVA